MDARCRIEFLGGLRVRQGDRWITRFRTQKTGALLAYLAYHGQRRHPREVLVDLLWPERDLDAGRNSLSTSLSSLRHQLEPPGVPTGAVIAADRAAVGFNPAAVTTDVADFEAALRAAERGRSRAERLQDLAAAVELYRGPLLPGYYEDWIGPEQERLAELHFQATRRLIADLEAEADLDRALSYARRAVSADPLREGAHQELIRLYAAAGRPADARRQYRELERLLEEELDTTPSPATRDLLHSMPSRAPHAPSPPASTKPPVPGPRPRPARRHTRSLPTGTVTFLLTDIEGSTALWERAGEAFPRALASHHTLLRRVFHQYGGLEVKETGDAFLVAFPRAADALEGAVAGQRALAGHPWPEEVEMLRVRMVLHTGDVELQDGDYHGLVLHRAARMLAAAHGGQILCSEATAAVLRRDLALGVRLGDLGVYRLRDVAMPERLFQVEYPDMPRRQFPPLHAEAGYAANLPLQLTRFFGREEELACLGEMLTPAPMVDVQWLMVNDRREVPSSTINHQSSTIGPARLVTLMGSGGSGKTRLALEVAARLVERFHGAVWFVPLADRVDARSIADAVLDTLRLPRSPHVEPLEQLVEALTRQPSLLLLDNFEQLVGEGAAIVRTMLERVATLQCLVTSRQALGLAGEREFVVAPLPTPGGAHIPEQLTLCESVQLFVDRAQAVRPDFQVTNANANAVAELCNRLEGIPLALELAAARSQVLTPAQILTHLEHRLDLLVSRRRDTAARQRSLRATIDWSYRLLPSELQQFFARLSVFRGGWTLEAAEEVCAEPLSLDYLAQLRECSLVEVEEARRAGGPDRPCRAAEGAEMRFRMLETLREYAAEQRTPEDRAALERRHLEHYLALAEEAEPGLAGPEEAGTHVVGGWLERLAAEYENVRAALRWGAEREPVLALRLAGALGQFWEVRGLWAEGRAALDQVSERAETAPPEFQIKASHWAGTLAWRQGEYEPARELLQRSLDLARAAGDPHGIVKALLGLGNVASDQGDDTLARALYAESLAVGRETGDSDEEAPGAGIAAALNGLGCIALDYRGDYPAARALFEESLAIRRQIGDRWAIAGSLNNLGLVALHQGDYPAAQAFHEEGLRLRREIGDRRGMALSLNNLGCIASNQGDHATARALYEQSLAIGREIGDPWAIAGSLNNLGEVAQAQGDDQSAGAFFMDALLVNRRLGNRSWQAISLDNLGELASARDETEAARAFYRESLELRRQIEERSGIAASLERFACLAAGQQQAEPHSPEGHASGLRALRLFGAAEALRAASGASLPPNKQGERDAHLATLRQHLGDTAFTAAWEVGSALTWQAAAAEALE